MTAIYRKRGNVFESGETEWRAEDDALVRKDAAGGEARFRWADVVAIRLHRNLTMSKRWLHQCTIATRDARITIDNAHFLRVGDFEDRSAAYSPFVRAALERIATLAPNARVEIGSTPAQFWPQVLFMSAGLAALAAVLIYIPLPASLPVVVAVKLAIVVYMLTLLPRWLRGSWPRHGDLKTAAAELP